MADVILKLIIDGKEFDAKIKDADKQIAGLKKGVEKHAVDMTTSLKSVAGAMGLAFGAATVINFLKTSINEYKEQESALKKLDIALGKVSESLRKFADEKQRELAFEDDIIIETMARIAMYIKDEEQIKSLTLASMDFARAKSIDLVQAGDLVAKSVGTETNALGRYGVTVEGAVGSVERFSSAQKGLGIFSGQAAGYMETAEGKMAKFDITIQNIAGSLGEKLLPLLDSMINKTNALIELGEKAGKTEWLMTLLKLGAAPLFLGKGYDANEYWQNLLRRLEANNAQVGKGNLMDAINQSNQARNILFQVQPQTTTATVPSKIEKQTEEIQKAGDALHELEGAAKQFQRSIGRRGLTGLLVPAGDGPGGEGATSPIKEMSDTMKQGMGVIEDTTDAMWQHLIIGGRQAVGPWDAIWLSFRNSALQRIGEIVQNEIWNWLLGTLFSFIPGVGGVAGQAVQAVTSTPAGGGSSLGKLKVQVEGKLQGEDIYISNKRTAQRKTDNSL